jgi:hypothetical protein
MTDLAFSLDSVTTAIALSRDVWVVLLGGTIGVITLRFMAGLFIRWLEEFEHLEDAGFVTVAIVGLRLLIRVANPEWVPPEWAMVALIALLFMWGFSKRVDEPGTQTQAQSGEDDRASATGDGNGTAHAGESTVKAIEKSEAIAVPEDYRPASLGVAEGDDGP